MSLRGASEELPDLSRYGHSLYHAFVDYCKQGSPAKPQSAQQRSTWVPKMSSQQLNNLVTDLALLQPAGPLRPYVLQDIFTRCRPSGSTHLSFGTFLQALAAISAEIEMVPDAVFSAVATLAVERPSHQQVPLNLTSTPPKEDSDLSTSYRQRVSSATPKTGRFQNLARAIPSVSAPPDMKSPARDLTSLRQAWGHRASGDGQHHTPTRHARVSDSAGAADPSVPAWAGQLTQRLAALETLLGRRHTRPAHEPGDHDTGDPGGGGWGGQHTTESTRNHHTDSSRAATSRRDHGSGSRARQGQSTSQGGASGVAQARETGSGQQSLPANAPWLHDLMAQVTQLRELGHRALQLSQESKEELSVIKQALPHTAQGDKASSAAHAQPPVPQGTLASLISRLDKLQEQQQATESTIAKLQAEMTDTVDTKLCAVEESFHARLASVNTTCSTLSSQVSAVIQLSKTAAADKDGAGPHPASAAALRDAVDRADAAETAAADAQRAAAQLQEQVDALQAKLATLEATVKKQRSSSSAADAKVESIEKVLAALQDNMPDTQARLQVHEEQLASLKLHQEETQGALTGLTSAFVPADQLPEVVERLTTVEASLAALKAGKKAMNVTTLAEQAQLQATQSKLEAETALLWQQVQRRMKEIEDLVTNANIQPIDMQRVETQLADMDLAQQQLSSQLQSAQLQLQSAVDQLAKDVAAAGAAAAPAVDTDAAAAVPLSRTDTPTRSTPMTQADAKLLSKVTKAVTTLQKDVEGLRATLASTPGTPASPPQPLESAPSSSGEDLAAVAAKQLKLAARVDKLTKELTTQIDAVKQDLAVAVAAAAAAKSQPAASQPAAAAEGITAVRDALTAQIAELGSSVKSLQGAVSDIEARSKAQAAGSFSKGVSKDAVQDMVKPVLKRVGELETAQADAASRMTEQLDGLAARLKGLEAGAAAQRPQAAEPAAASSSGGGDSASQQQLERLAEQLQQLQADVQSQYKQLEARLKEQGSKLKTAPSADAHKQALSDMQTQIDKLQSDMQSQQKQADASWQEQLKRAQADLTAQLSKLQRELQNKLMQLGSSPAAATQAEVTTRASAAQPATDAAAAGDVKQQLGTVTVQLQQLSQLQSDLQSQLDSLQQQGSADTATLRKTVDDLQRQLNDVRASVPASAAKAVEMVQTRVSDIADELITVQKQLVTPPPADPSLLRRLNEVETVIRDMQREAKTTAEQPTASIDPAEFESLQKSVKGLDGHVRELQQQAASAARSSSTAIQQQLQMLTELQQRVGSLDAAAAQAAADAKSQQAAATQQSDLAARLDSLDGQLRELQLSQTQSAAAAAASADWAEKTRDLATKVAALEAALQQTQTPPTPTSPPAPATRKLAKGESLRESMRSVPGGDEDRPSQVKKGAKAAAKAVDDLRTTVYADGPEGLVPRKELRDAMGQVKSDLDACLSRVAALEKQGGGGSAAAAAVGASAAGQGLEAQVEQLRANIFAKTAEGMVQREEMARALGAVAQEVNNRLKDLTEQMATVQAAAATHAASGAAAPASGADAAGLQLLAQTSMDMRQRLDSLYAEVAEFKAGFAGVNIVHELEDLRSALATAQLQMRSIGGGSAGGHDMQTKLDEVSSALMLVTERINGRVAQLEAAVSNITTAIQNGVGMNAGAMQANRAYPPESPSLAMGMGAAQQPPPPQARPMTAAPASSPGKVFWPGTAMAAPAAESSDSFNRNRPQSARDNVHMLIAQERQQKKRMEEKLKEDEERIRMQRAAAQSFQIGAAGRRTQQEDEDAGGHDSSGGYGALLRQRANTTGGYLSGESGTTRESPNGRTVGFRLSGTGNHSDSGAKTLNLDEMRPRATSFGHMLMMGANGQMQSLSPAQLAAMQQSYKAKQQMALQQQKQQNQMGRL